MTITIFFENGAKQVIKATASFVRDNKTYGDQYTAAKAIAHDISQGLYTKFEISE